MSHGQGTVMSPLVLEFPSDFVNASTDLQGNYTVILVSKNTDHVLTSIPFYVVTNPVLSSFSNFLFSKGVAITFGIVGLLSQLYIKFFHKSTKTADVELKTKQNG